MAGVAKERTMKSPCHLGAARCVVLLRAAALTASLSVSGCSGSDVTHLEVQPPIMQRESGGPGSTLVWVANNDYQSSSLTGYQVTDSGDPEPTQIITGSATQLINPYGLFKTKGTLFVTQVGFDNFYAPSIDMYP